jgi:hypothetical protein
LRSGGSKAAHALAETPLHEFVGGEHLASKILWNEQDRDEHAGYEIAQHYL